MRKVWENCWLTPVKQARITYLSRSLLRQEFRGVAVAGFSNSQPTWLKANLFQEIVQNFQYSFSLESFVGVGPFMP